MTTVIKVAESLIKMNRNWVVKRFDIQAYGADSIEGYIGYLDIEGLGSIRIDDSGAFRIM